MISSRSFALALLGLTLIYGCKSSEEFSGFSYDPEGATETTTKKINPQYKHTLGIVADGVWLSNEFEGARLNNFYKANDTLYQAIIEPENHPINNSPWYAFKAWADTDTTIWLKLSYKYAEHRYVPKLSTNGTSWKRINTQDYRVSKIDSSAFLRLHLDENPQWVSAQELRTTDWFTSWADSMAQKSFTGQDIVGFSRQQRPIRRLTITEVPKGQERGVVIITSRLHPPEVTGNMACIAFLEELSSNTELANNFRQQFEVVAYPFANPDGVQNGHWRHNAGGVDLNRDWQNFNQPETQTIRDDLYSRYSANHNAKVYYGIDFHSTNENIFYPINREVQTFPDDFTYRWINAIKGEFPDVTFAVEPFDTSSPITKNWIYKTFGADAVTYEVDDGADRQKLKQISRRAAQLMMQQLLDEKQ